jgi:hypothetical protein
MKHVDVELSQNEFDALVAFVFNVGEPQFANSTLLRVLNTGDKAGAAEHFAEWNHQDGKVLPGLTVRRAQEKALFTAAARLPPPEPMLSSARPKRFSRRYVGASQQPEVDALERRPVVLKPPRMELRAYVVGGLMEHHGWVLVIEP